MCSWLARCQNGSMWNADFYEHSYDTQMMPFFMRCMPHLWWKCLEVLVGWSNCVCLMFVEFFGPWFAKIWRFCLRSWSHSFAVGLCSFGFKPNASLCAALEDRFVKLVKLLTSCKMRILTSNLRRAWSPVRLPKQWMPQGAQPVSHSWIRHLYHLVNRQDHPAWRFCQRRKLQVSKTTFLPANLVDLWFVMLCSHFFSDALMNICETKGTSGSIECWAPVRYTYLLGTRTSGAKSQHPPKSIPKVYHFYPFLLVLLSASLPSA